MRNSKAFLLSLFACAAAFCLVGCVHSSPPESSSSESSVGESSAIELRYEALDDREHTYGDVVEAHDFEASVTAEPTCERAGEKTLVCVKCGYVKTEALPALGHDWSDVVATLAWNGSQYIPSAHGVCKTCQRELPEGAAWSDIEVENTATCTQVGKLVYTAALTFDGEVIVLAQAEEESGLRPHLESEYSADEHYHWYAKQGYCHCVEIVEEKVPHDLTTVCDYESATTSVSCSVCGYNAVLDYVRNDPTVRVGDNHFYLTTPKTKVNSKGYWTTNGTWLQKDPEIPGNYLVPILPENTDGDYWQNVTWTSKPESELIQGVDYEELRVDTQETKYDILATFTAEETGAYTFSLPPNTLVAVDLTASPSPYNVTYYTVGCDVFYGYPTHATILLQKGDTVAIKAESVNPNPDANLSYGGAPVYEFDLTVSFEASALPGKSADDPIFVSFTLPQAFALNAGESIFYAVEYSDYIAYTYKYFTLTFDHPVELWTNGKKLNLRESPDYFGENLLGYTSTTLKCEQGKPVLVEIRNASEERLELQMSGDVYDLYPYILEEGVNELVLPVADLTRGVELICYVFDEEGNRLPFTMNLDEASFTASETLLYAEGYDWETGATTTPVAGYIDGAFSQFPTEILTECHYFLRCPTGQTGSVTLRLTITRVEE